jgi:uncharacterized protein (DUF849 family)
MSGGKMRVMSYTEGFLMDRKFILNFTPTGLIPTKEMTPEVPVLPKKIIHQVLEASDLGVNMVHLHARELENGAPTHNKEIYAETINGIRSKNRDIIICASTSGRVFFEFDKRSEVLDLEGGLKPDFASLTPSSLNFNKEVSINSPQMIQDLAKKDDEKSNQAIIGSFRPRHDKLRQVFDQKASHHATLLLQFNSGKRCVRPGKHVNSGPDDQ